MTDDPAKTKLLPDGPAGELPVGATLSQGMYRVTGRIAAGGFGITYEARDNLDRKVAIKECFPAGLALRSGEFTVSAASVSTAEPFETARTLFLREARTLAALRHPNIVHVQTLFEENGTAYMAMDFVDGRDLQHVIAHEPDLLTPAYLMELTRALLAALDYLHRDAPERGKERLLHRDIKPANIRIDPLDTPVVIDFGAARQETKTLSRAAGTFRVVSDGYSPNEFYVAGAEQGPASDLYSLAATLYHCVTGAAPAPADARAQKVSNGEEDPYAPIAGRYPAHDPRLLALIDRALSRPLRERPADAAAWFAAIPDSGLDTTTRIITPAANPAPVPEKRSALGKVAPLALAGLAGCAVAIGAVMMLPAATEPDGANASALATELAAMTDRADGLEDDLSAAMDARDAAGTRAEVLESDVAALEEEIETLTAQGANPEDMAALEAARAAADRDAVRARADMERMATALREAEAEADQLTMDLRAARAEIARLAAETAAPPALDQDPDPTPPLTAEICPNISAPGVEHRFTGTDIYTAQTLITQAGATQLLSACADLPDDARGFADTQPNFTVFLTEMEQFRRVEMQVVSDCNTTLLARTQDGAWHFDDDSNGGILPLLNVTGPQANAGRMDIWIGTTDGIPCAASVELETWLN